MTIEQALKEGFTLTAHSDGGEVHLAAEKHNYDTGDYLFKDIDWPEHWPNTVTRGFLQREGFLIV